MSNYKRTALKDIIAKYGIAGVHPAADVLPLMNDEEFDGICEDVQLLGFLEAIKVTDDGLLIDGRNRLQVAWALGKDPIIQRHNPTDVLAYVLSENLHRRHLSTGQKAMVAEKIANLPHGGAVYSAGQKAMAAEKIVNLLYGGVIHSAQKNEVVNPTSLLITRKEAAKKVGSTEVAISQARAVREWAPEEVNGVTTGDVALEKAYQKARARKKAAQKIAPPEKAKAGPKLITLAGIVDKKLIEVEYPQPKGKHQFNRTNEAVDWASWTWNPVTGCLHGCKYCYAREMAYRDSYAASYPIQFAPLFHYERLDDPVNTEPGNGRAQDGRVFVCSMADLFGEWVPQDWIDAVFDATLKAPEWEYLFLTKFPQRYRRINLPSKAWFGASVDIQKRVKVTEKAMPGLDVAVRWASVEPMLEPIIFNDLSWCDLLVIGAQSETMQPDGPVPAFAPKLEWVIDLIAQARSFDVPVYLKPNLLGDLTGSKPGMQLPQEQPRRRKK